MICPCQIAREGLRTDYADYAGSSSHLSDGPDCGASPSAALAAVEVPPADDPLAYTSESVAKGEGGWRRALPRRSQDLKRLAQIIVSVWRRCPAHAVRWV